MKRLFTIAVIGCAALTTVVTSGVVHAGAATAASSTPVRKIVYAGESGGIGLVNADGSGNHQISAVSASSVSFSPNGSQIAYTSAGQVWTKPVTGGSARQLTHASGGAFSARWSPNGRWIAFTSEVGSHAEIFRVPATGGSTTRLTFASHGCNDEQSAWSPDSSTIAYVSDANGNPSCSAVGLVVALIGRTGAIVVPEVVSSPSFTPVGNLVYVATCDGCEGHDVGWEANADGTGQTIVDMGDDCDEGDRCLGAMIGAPRSHGWVEVSSYGGEDEPFGTCFFGAFQQAGVVNGMAPDVCLDNVLVDPGAADVI